MGALDRHGLDLDQRMVDSNDAAAQADQAMENAKILLEEAGSSLDHVCKVTTYLTDPAYRTGVYNTVGRHLKGNPTVATGLIVKGLAMPEMKVELDLEAVTPEAGEHKKFRLLNTGDWFGQNSIDRDSCMAVNTGDEIYLRGQTGTSICGKFVGYGDPGAQAHQAMKNITTLLEEAGTALDDICKISIYILHRGHREAVYQAVGRHLERDRISGRQLARVRKQRHKMTLLKFNGLTKLLPCRYANE